MGGKGGEGWEGDWRFKALKYFLSQKRDLVGDCQKCDGHTHTHRVTMRGEGLICFEQLKMRFLNFTK